MANLIPREKFVVFPCASSQDGACFPSIGVEFERADGSRQTAYRHLRELGTFRTLDAAWAVAKTVEVESVDEDGVVVFVPGNR